MDNIGILRCGVVQMLSIKVPLEILSVMTTTFGTRTQTGSFKSSRAR